MKHIYLAATLITANALPTEADDTAWTPEDSKMLTAHVEAGQYQNVTSVLVMRDGETLYEGYFHGADASTLHDTRSATKTVVSMAVGAAIKAGKMTGPAQTLAPLFPDYKKLTGTDKRKAAITVEDLLTMSGPLECDDWNQFSRGNEERMYITDDWTAFYWSLPLRGYPSWQTPPSKEALGRSFSYCTAGVQLLGQAVGRAVGETAPRFIEEHVFKPAGVRDFEWRYNGKGEAHLGGGLLLSTRALGKLGEVGRKFGAGETGTVFSEDWGKASLTPHADLHRDTWQYGYLWWLKTYDVAGTAVRTAAMNGNGGNRVWVLPEYGVTVVLTKTDYNTRGMHEAAEAFLTGEILPRITGERALIATAPEKD